MVVRLLCKTYLSASSIIHRGIANAVQSQSSCPDLGLVPNRRAREDLAASYRGLDYYKLGEGVCNHLTVRAGSRSGHGDVMLLIPYGLHWSKVTASSLLGVDIHSRQVVEGEGIVEDSAVCIHTSVYRALDDVRCIMHAHPPYSTALSCLKDPRLKMIHQGSLRFFGKIAYDLEFKGTGDMGDESERLAKNMKGKSVMVMGNHGLMTIGPSVHSAFDDFYYFERAAMFQMISQGSGQELSIADDKVSQDVSDYYTRHGAKFSHAHLEGIKQVLSDKSPNYAS